MKWAHGGREWHVWRFFGTEEESPALKNGIKDKRKILDARAPGKNYGRPGGNL